MGRLIILYNMLKKTFLRMCYGSLRYAMKNGLVAENDCIVSSGCDFGSEPYLIKLHHNVRISTGVTLLTHDGGVHTINARMKNSVCKIHKYGRIEIGDNTFIGANAIVLPGCFIGKNLYNWGWKCCYAFNS